MFFFDVNKKYWVGLRLNAKIITFPLMAFKKACLLLLNENIKEKISAKYVPVTFTPRLGGTTNCR